MTFQSMLGKLSLTVLVGLTWLRQRHQNLKGQLTWFSQGHCTICCGEPNLLWERRNPQ